MAHQIREHDHIMVTGKKAWHGLGTVVQEAPSPHKALELARMRWDVIPCPLTALHGDDLQERISVESHVANVRSDTKEVLGIVSDSYSIVQNEQIAELIWAAAESGACPKIESAGSLKNGRVVFFCARMESMFIAGADEVVPYFSLISSHDGTLGLSAQGNTFRVVCDNTQRAATRDSKRNGRYVSLRHTSNIKERIPEIKTLFEAVKEGVTVYEKKAQALAKRKLSTHELESFFKDVWQRSFGAIPNQTERETKSGTRKYNKCLDTVSHWLNNFESPTCNNDGIGGTAWAAMQACTEWDTHQRTAKATATHGHSKTAAREWRRLKGTDFGDKAMEAALATI